ncbi:PREDICTED: zinc metalloproteinase nas-4-like [Wasmannia auropunctata]|uniref:zinc metalloproteinase nas-4-like n=1 Tax=Wasmannia auropunctata TaxID=64793 RepID=UPI0005F04A19|nr:PREDICTED: zinc metalloproteinase nas-4-like [Wasmannia auropunctata]
MICRLLITFAWTLSVFAIFASAIPYTRDTKEMPMMVPDKETGARVAKWTKEMNVNPEELGGYFEGDIMLIKNTNRNGLKNEATRWPNRVVPYKISGNFNKDQKNLIHNAMKAYHNYTCIRFKPQRKEKNYVNIISENTGCHSNIGRIGGQQIVNLQIPGCVTLIGTAIHELMHALGFFHEHTREDRDDYVDIIWNNIQEPTKGNFVKDTPGTADSFNTSYDYGSVMHYSAYAFAIDKEEKTIVPTEDPDAEIGQREGFSEGDIKRINTMYNCA